ncbi:esterase [Mycolicibacterium sp. CH28]|uniref:alpha/beta hydrolase n=1 Tax=Mycolicibacterium sp. CH28 TaxID=2512237 RepID=UPI0010820B32|nr:alpha/beta hydrolase-fold protein [Mycolicibacterium sp. CH28]TGD88357.1 esterase [Mycolicibacterium sp. CH28]
MLDWPLLTGPLPLVLQIGAAIAGAWLLIRMVLAPRSPLVKVISCVAFVAGAAVVTLAGDHLARNVWELFPDRIPLVVLLWAGAAVFTLCMAASLAAVAERWPVSAGLVIASAIVVAACANQVNAVFGAFPTPRDALGMPRPDDVALPSVHAHTLALATAEPLERSWRPPPGLGTSGKLTSAVIAGPSSRFVARRAKIYLPPAYFSDLPPRLPVLVLLTGQPGTPQDWISAGKLPRIMDTFAHAHRGLAPVVVVPDPTGGPLRDPLCLNSPLGNVDTYLAVDVPAWIKTNLNVDPRPNTWAVAGASYGGTCALQLATNHSDVYPNFIDIAGSAEPTLGDRRRTVAAAFGGDDAAFNRVNPLDLLKARRYPGSAAAIVVGTGDRDTLGDAQRVHEATKAAGMESHLTELPGSHDWRVFAAALAKELPWLAKRVNLID